MDGNQGSVQGDAVQPKRIESSLPNAFLQEKAAAKWVTYHFTYCDTFKANT